jgi:hypothetical protein
MTKPVKLLEARLWHCPNCGHGNVNVIEDADLDDETAEEAYRSFHSMEPWQELPTDWRDFKMICIPLVVECGKCAAGAA